MSRHPKGCRCDVVPETTSRTDDLRRLADCEEALTLVEAADVRSTEELERLRAILRATAGRAHMTGCRPLDRLALSFWSPDWTQCPNAECMDLRTALNKWEAGR